MQDLEPAERALREALAAQPGSADSVRIVWLELAGRLRATWAEYNGEVHMLRLAQTDAAGNWLPATDVDLPARLRDAAAMLTALAAAADAAPPLRPVN